MELVTYREKPVLHTHVSLSSKGQIVIVSQARNKYLPEDMDGFTQDVFRDGTIVLKPKRRLSEREMFVHEAEAYYETYRGESTEAKDSDFLTSPEQGGEIID
ncbi:MAG: hypothetical protein LBV19_07655 [Streptococcaceae bacterium]|jgi:bifunctional DNA-binding transcriptional regulator/antitoxin component of YhaV-PrlF toxin-antitoxin module|nr:hypothetical protein [Streptococcaceae bacterium]